MTVWTKIKEAEKHWRDETGERFAWPDVVQYTDGAAVADTPDSLPAGAQGGYRFITHDVEAREMLTATGLLYDGRHRGAWTSFDDRRNAPGA